MNEELFKYHAIFQHFLESKPLFHLDRDDYIVRLRNQLRIKIAGTLLYPDLEKYKFLAHELYDNDLLYGEICPWCCTHSHIPENTNLLVKHFRSCPYNFLYKTFLPKDTKYILRLDDNDLMYSSLIIYEKRI